MEGIVLCCAAKKDDDQKTSVGRLLSNVCTKVAGVGTRLFVRVAVFLSVPVGPGLVVPVWCSLLLLSYHRSVHRFTLSALDMYNSTPPANEPILVSRKMCGIINCSLFSHEKGPPVTRTEIWMDRRPSIIGHGQPPSSPPVNRGDTRARSTQRCTELRVLFVVQAESSSRHGHGVPADLLLLLRRASVVIGISTVTSSFWSRKQPRAVVVRTIRSSSSIQTPFEDRPRSRG